MKDKLLYIGIAQIILALLLLVIVNLSHTTSPVEKYVIDSLAHANDSLQSKINELDSIRDAKVIEVYNLDNDSTIKLFYKLVKR